MAVVQKFAVSSHFEHTANTFTLGPQLAPDVLGLSGGGHVVAYNNTSLTSGLILLDFYDADLDSVGAVSIPFDDSATTDAAGEPSVTQLANGNVLVVWDEQNDTNSEAGIKGALFEEDGTLVDADIQLDSGGLAFKDLDVTALSNGNFAVSFAFGSFEMFQLYTPAGVKIGGAHVLNQVTVGTQKDAQLTALEGGGLAAVWTDVNTDQLKGRIYENDGTARTDEFQLAGFSGKSQASVAALQNGNFAVVCRDTAWSEPGTAGAGITLQIFDENGFDQEGFIQVNSVSEPDESDPDVTVLANGFILVSWSKPVAAGNTDIMGRIFTESGDAVTVGSSNQEFVITSSASDDTLSSVSAMLGGRFAAAWQDTLSDGSSGQVTAEVMDLIRTSLGDDSRNLIVGDLLMDAMNGGKGADTLEGAGNDDSLFGAEGSDSIVGGEGRDLLEGGERDDTLLGGDGDDTIYTVNRFQSVNTVDGAGKAFGGDGNDRIFGASAGDTLRGEAGDDSILGGAGNDSLQGAQGKDTLRGGDGNDTLDGAQGSGLSSDDNTIDGGAGDDRLLGDAGQDLMTGGLNNDRLFGSSKPDTLDGGDGIDTVDYSQDVNRVTASLATGVGEGLSSLVFSAGDVYIGIENLVGGFTGDILTGDDRDNRIEGRTGNDTIRGGDGDDTLLGGSTGGSDRITGGKGRDVMEAGLNDDIFFYLSVRDALVDPAKRDVIEEFIGAQGDKIDLSAIDAREGGKDNAFVFVAAFTGAKGQLIAPETSTGVFLVQGDVDGDAVADFAIEVRVEEDSGDVITGADFIL